MPDSRTAALDLLTGPDAEGLLATALGSAGAELLSHRVSGVDHRPGSASRPGTTTVAYRARVRRPDGDRCETLAATTAPVPAGPGVLTLSDGGRTVSVWGFRDDPALPTLAAATSPVSMGALLASFGVVVPGGDVRVVVRSYRPRRRAVVEVTGPGVRFFVKVLRPTAVAALHERHRLLHDAGVPVPRSLGWTDDGLLLLAPLDGSTVREEMRGARPLPTAAGLLTVLDALPQGVLDLPRRPSWTDGVEHYARVVAATAPVLAERVTQLAAAVRAGVVDAPVVPTHGDCYESQLLVGPEAEVTGVLDVDTAGPGHRADDLACLLAHASLLAAIEPAHTAATSAAVTGWTSAFSRTVDPVDLRHRVAGVLVSLATGPYRVQEEGWLRATGERLDLVERWLSRRG